MSGLVNAEYVPSEDEPFMSERQKAYFRAKLVRWKNDILREARETLDALQQENANLADLADRASSETDRAIELRARDRQRKLIAKIDAALSRIDEGTYGYCEETGEPISVKRLDARPIATLSIEAQERHERREKVYRDE
ncbi:MAG: RNA polymerase-binding protein DksA [Rhizobiaceae bacterium]